ncbi:hypothetical protein [Acanthopleuribacter pedis]|uniref:Uncharacterized protein n=1 Tax=Acanthopleuribacter pedis TaxID=442870 RepID=A0A8J7U4I8_9BACT|nr:hypothetical protein [Acanthopleuribacter pedis]MBO1320687.1 hypothetical protein [Acanthopleuribacter pedis]
MPGGGKRRSWFRNRNGGSIRGGHRQGPTGDWADPHPRSIRFLSFSILIITNNDPVPEIAPDPFSRKLFFGILQFSACTFKLWALYFRKRNQQRFTALGKSHVARLLPPIFASGNYFGSESPLHGKMAELIFL